MRLSLIMICDYIPIIDPLEIMVGTMVLNTHSFYTFYTLLNWLIKNMLVQINNT